MTNMILKVQNVKQIISLSAKQSQKTISQTFIFCDFITL